MDVDGSSAVVGKTEGRMRFEQWLRTTGLVLLF